MPKNYRINPALLAQAESLVSQAGHKWSDFTPAEQECISRKLRRCDEKGMDRDQAIAIAIKECAPSKALASKIQSSAGFGGRYQWSRNADGTYNIFDVPVFVKHTRKLGMKLEGDGNGGLRPVENVITVDEKWLSRAVEINRRRTEQGDYLGALHVRHHPRVEGEPDRSEPAGHFILKFVRPIEYDGETLPALFADFVKVPEAIFERIRKGLLPYRSVECLPPKYEEIDSIALLETETPWFRLPLLTLGEEIKREVFSASPQGSQILHGYARAGQAWAALCYFAGEQFEEKKGKPSEDDEDEDEDEDEAQEEKIVPDDEEKSEIAEEEGADAMAKILEALQAIAKMNEAILQKLGANTPPTEPAKDAPIREPGAPPAQSSADRAETLALQATVARLQKERDVERKVKAALAGLASYNLAADEEEKLFAAAMESPDPGRVIDRFVESIKKYAQQMPAGDSSAGTAGGAHQEVAIPDGTPDEIRAYAAKGPEVLRRALEASAQYDEARRMGVISGSMTRAQFVAYRLNRDAVVVTG